MKHRTVCMLPTKRQNLIWLGLMVALLSSAGCSFAPKMHLVSVAPDGTGFVEAKSGQAYVPWGTNYYDPNTGWPPQVWKQFDAEKVRMHFGMMHDMGVNVARVFLAAATFQPDVETVDEQALQKLDTLIEIARAAGIRLILTGPDHWEGMPSYWKPDRFAGEEAIKALENFWTVVGQRYQGEPTILAWDLLNEPAMPWSVDSWQPRWNAYLQSKYGNQDGLKNAWGEELPSDETLGSIVIPKNKAKRGSPRLLDWQRFREHLADRWVQRQVEALRRVDPTHMITVGYVQWSYPVVRPGDPNVYSAFNPHRQAQWLDFISVHFYPLMGRPYGSKDNWDNNLAYLQTILAYCHTGKPVVLEEYGWYGGGSAQGRPLLTEDEQGRWLAAEVEASRRLAQGWLSWPFADTPQATDLSQFGGLVKYNYILKLWSLCFKAYAKKLSVLPQPTPPLPSCDLVPSLTAPVDDLLPMHQEYARQVQEALEKAGPMPEVDPKSEFPKPELRR